MKTADAAKDFDKYFLGQVGSIGLVAKGAREQRINWLGIVCDQPGESLLRTPPQLFDQSRFVGLERECAGNVAHGEVRLQFSVLPRYRTSSIVCTHPSFAPIVVTAATHETRKAEP